MGRTVVVGTAGHVDHGKSSLVKALTGTDPDRLKEEQERGITIDLGFAHAAARDGMILSFVDVPGHERFVRNMLAGAAGIDVVLLVVAADESVMPQTREHLDVCRLLDVRSGVVALTKSDLVDEETLDLVRLEVSELVSGSFLHDAPIVACSAVTRAGLDELVEELVRAADRAPARLASGPFRMPIDRAFTLKGFGAVVTGTALTGSLMPGDEVEILPAGRRCRVRGVQVHGSASEAGAAGQRVALNLGGIEHHDLQRGDVVVTPGSHVASSAIDAAITMLPEAPELADLARVRLHLGTAEVMARVRWAGEPPEPGGTALAQLRLESPIVAAAGDRFILRRYSPVATIGGGRVLHPAPPGRLRRTDAPRVAALARQAEALSAGRPGELLALLAEEAGPRGVSETDLAAWSGWTAQRVREALQPFEPARLARIAEAPRRWMAAGRLDAALEEICARLKEFHRAQPLAPGHPKQALLIATGLDETGFAALLELGVARKRLTVSRDQVSLAGHAVSLTAEEERARELLLEAHSQSGLSPPDTDALLGQLGVDRQRAQRVVRLLLGSGELVKVKEGMLLHGDVMARLLRDMASWYSPGQSFSVPDFKERSGTSRKHAIPLLECLDALGCTRRQGEGRVFTGERRK